MRRSRYPLRPFWDGFFDLLIFALAIMILVATLYIVK